MPAPIPGSVSVGEAKSKPDDMALLLRQHGALDELPDFTRIRITRQGLNQPHEVFGRAAKQTNQFTLLETLMRFYGRQSVFSEARKTFGPPYEILPFPDFGRIIIRRPALKPGGKEQEIKVSLLNGKNLLDCAKDVPVEFGDVIEIPERVHALNASMENPPGQVAGMFAESQQVAARMKQMAAEGLTREHPSMVKAANKKSETDAVACLRKVVQLVVGGNTTGLTVDSWTGGFLTEAIAKSEARAALRSSSDLARVQVKRKDAKSGKAMVLTVDATDANDSLWLQDGDVIEVPDRP